MSLAPATQLPRHRSLWGVVDDLASGLPVTDFRFDAIYPAEIRARSAMHWTPVAIARRAAQLLYVGPNTNVLDVGSGVGKFCTVAALTCPGTYTGVEQRGALVAIARQVAQRYDVPRVSYLHAPVDEVSWTGYTGFYFYNPFAENYYRPEERIDDTLPFGNTRFQALVSFVQRRLEELPLGTRFVTFHGYGGEVMPGWVLVRRERFEDDYLILWERRW